MDEFELKMKILLDILDKKNNSISQILTITENQENVLIYADESEVDAIFNEMNVEKQKLIDEVLNADNVFQNIFDEISEAFAERAEDHRELVGKIQRRIKDVMDTDIKIRLQEQKNLEHISKSSKKFKIDAPKASKNYMMKQYNSYKKPRT